MKTEKMIELQKRICKGCIDSIISDEGYAICKPINKHGEECPCSNCLVKMICRHSCLEFKDYLHTLKQKENDKK